MKHKGALMEYSKERADDLMRAYNEYIASCKYILMEDVCKHVVNMPTKRFWVSGIRASLVISKMMRGEANLNKMCATKRDMFEEIFRRVIKLRETYPNKSISELCAIVVAQPAPKFYLTPGSARIYICKARYEWTRRKQQRLFRL